MIASQQSSSHLVRPISSISVCLKPLAVSLGVLFATGPVNLPAAPLPAAPPALSKAADLGGVALPFVANNGQTDSRVAFYAPTFAGSVYVTRQGELVYALPAAGDASGGWTLVERFEQGRALPAGSEQTPSQVGYVENRDGKAVTRQAETFGAVDLGAVFSGISVRLRAHGRNVEKIYTLAPGADPARIQMSVAGATGLSVDGSGNLVATTGHGSVTFSAPLAWQERGEEKVPVAVRYTLRGDGYGFALAGYDRSLPVIIDPLLQATYLGGSSRDEARTIAVSPQSGDVFVAGLTDANPANNFPGTAGGFQAQATSLPAPQQSIFLARLTADLKSLVQATYLNAPIATGTTIGGQYLSLKIHPRSGDAYLAYTTDKTAYATIKVPGDAGGTVLCGDSGSSFAVSRFSSDLRQLVQSTCLPVFQPNAAHFLLNSTRNPSSATFDLERFVIHPGNGDLYFGGSSVLQNHGSVPDRDAVVIRLPADLKGKFASASFGGVREDHINGLTIHPVFGDVYVVGTTTFNDFPVTAGVFQPQSGFQASTGVLPDAFVASLGADLAGVKQASYLGGSLADSGSQILIGSEADRPIYVLSTAASPDFPALAGGAIAGTLPKNGGANVISRISADLSRIQQSTLVTTVPTVASLNADFQLLESSSNAEILALPRHGTGVGADTKTYRFSSDLTLLVGTDELLPGAGGQIGLRNYVISPLSGDLYVTGHESAATTTFAYPGTSGGFQPASSISRGGREDSFIARYTANDLGGIGTGGIVTNPDQTPKLFKFKSKKRVKLDALVRSAKVKIKGIKAGKAPIAVLNGEYAIGCKKAAFTSASGTIANKQTVCVRHRSAADRKTVVTTTLRIGGAIGSFSSRTR